MFVDCVNFAMQKVQKVLTLRIGSKVEGGFWWLSESLDSREKCSGIGSMMINDMCVISRFGRIQSIFVGGNMIRVHLLMDSKSSLPRETFQTAAFLLHQTETRSEPGGRFGKGDSASSKRC